jgi:hypothetical protein
VLASCQYRVAAKAEQAIVIAAVMRMMQVDVVALEGCRLIGTTRAVCVGRSGLRLCNARQGTQQHRYDSSEQDSHRWFNHHSPPATQASR